ncbi:MAG TPA: MMPL family transporter [Burkholderiales bacterium]|nr:MMPL family transporter [Burkholderiales bacterium]
MKRGGRTAVAAWLILVAASGIWLTQRLVLTTDMSAFLPQAATRAQELLIGQLRSGVASRLLLLAVEDAGEEVLAKASTGLADRLARSGQFETVANGDAARAARDLQQLFALRYVLSPGVVAERFTAAGLHDALQESLALLASPLSAPFRSSLPQDPTGELRRLARLFERPGGPATRQGVWFSGDGKRALLVVETRAPGFDLDAQAKAIATIQRAYAEVAPAGARLRLAGPGLAAVTARATVERDAARSSTIATIGILLLLLYVYRSPWPVALSALPAASGLLGGITAVSLWFGPVHGITMGFAAILIGEAIDYPTYLFAQTGRHESLAETLGRIGATLRLAVLTTSCGALSMLLSSFNGLAQLGFLTIVGVIVAGLVTRWVLPALTPARILERKLAASFDWPLPAWLGTGAAWGSVLAIACVALVAIHRNDRLWDDDLANLTPVAGESKALDRELRSQLGAPDPRYLVVLTAPGREDVLQKSERIARVLDGAITSGAIGGYELAARYLPSEKTQQERRAALPDAETLATNLGKAMTGLPFRPGAFSPFLAAVERARNEPPLELESLGGTAFGTRINSLLFPGSKDWVALAPISGVRDAAALAAALRSSGEHDVLLLDLKQEADGLVAGYRAEALRLLMIGLACIALLVCAGLRSLAATGRVLAPVLAATLLDVATLSMAGVKLTLFHLVALLLVVGVGTNYALFFNQPQGSRDEHALMLLSLAVASFATLLSALALAASGTPVLRAIGVTVAIGTVYALTFSALLARHPGRAASGPGR